MITHRLTIKSNLCLSPESLLGFLETAGFNEILLLVMTGFKEIDFLDCYRFALRKAGSCVTGSPIDSQ